MPTLAGKATVYHIDGTVAFTGLLATENALAEVDFTDEFDLSEFKRQGATIGLAAADRRQNATFSIIPFDPSTPSTLATARTKVVLPSPLAKVTIAGFGTAPNNIAEFVGDWNYIGGGTIRKSDDNQPIRVTLPCRRHGDDPATATAFDVVSG